MTEIEKLLATNYQDVCNYLKNKYGHVAKDYFTDETMTKAKIRWSIKRGKEGLLFIILMKIRPLNYLRQNMLNLHHLLFKKPID